MNISLIGGDLRIARLAEMYAKEGNLVYTYGLEKICEEPIKKCKTLKEAIQESKIVISGMPLTKDGKNINTPFSEKQIALEDVMQNINGKIFIAGNIPKKLTENNLECIDLLQDEALTILNAIPTVEGTIRIVIEEREETIHESNVLICGFGRIGKILCKDFKALGANVYCAARKESDFAWIREQRYIPISYTKIPEIGQRFDIIINTVPHTILSKKELESLKSDVLIVDVASLPGGIDKDIAKTLNLNVITALGIPGKEFPRTAAKYIKETIDKIL